MTHKSQMETDLDAIMNTDEFAESATYRTSAGAVVSTTCFIDVGDEMAGGVVGSSSAAVASIVVRKSAVADPGVDDVVTVNGVSWRVVHVLREEDGLWILTAVKDERMIAR